MLVTVYNTAGEAAGEHELPEYVFGIKPNRGVMHQALERQLANARQGTHNTKSRGEVQGGGRKPWRQKGTGRARHGSIRSPIWVGGGAAFGPTPRKYRKRMPKKMRRLALRSALSAKHRAGQIVVLDEFALDRPRTREMVEILDCLTDAAGSVIILLADRDIAVEKSVNNLPYARTLRAQYLNVRDLLGYDYVVIPLAALEVIEAILGEPRLEVV
ncbi:MAG: 50S ribosomal protein L4 [Anaerolineae bacterium]